MRWENEEQFIYEFIKLYYGNGNYEKLNKYISGSSYEKVAEKIIKHGIAGLVYNAEYTGRVSLTLPFGVFKSLKAASSNIAINNMFYEIEGMKLLEDINKMDIGYVLLKGFSYMEDMYGNTGIRPVSDLDILIDRSNYKKLKEFLVSEGFKYDSSINFIGGTGEEFINSRESSNNEVHFYKAFDGRFLNIDLHWGVEGFVKGSPLMDIFPIHNYPWLKYKEIQYVSGKKISCLSSEMHLIHLIFHFSLSHQFMGVKWFIDICQFISKNGKEINWDFIDNMIKEPECRKVFGITLNLVLDVMGETSLSRSLADKFFANNIKSSQYMFYKQRLFYAF
jgi:hypothetical protein